MRAGKELALESDLEVQKALFGSTISKKKTKKEELIDKKIEFLLETYKKQDEELMKKAQGHMVNKEYNKKILRDKFGFADDDSQEGDDDELKKTQSYEKKVTGKTLPSYSAQAQHIISHVL